SSLLLEEQEALLYNEPLMLSRIIAIVGPTASGKSDLGIFLAQKLQGEIISADSRQVYKGMDIGTGKVSKLEQKLVPHHLLDVADPKRDFSASRFKTLAQKAIKEISNKNKIPILVGGTGFYIDTLMGKFSLPAVKPNKKLREHLEKFSTDHLFKVLCNLDPERAASIDRHNKHRLVRALEIVLITGKPVPKLNPTIPYEILWLGVDPKNLEKRIKLRLDKRLEHGMIEEVIKLHRQGVSFKRLEKFGLEYYWMARYLQDKVTLEAMKSGLLQDIFQYSKRQMTWFKKNHDIHWVHTKSESLRLAQKFVEERKV
ncbi:MAG: tRNA (adenosine(37)-N6)-dimethylallyltransferase MiaA, partial [Candidatus Yanofskybacteria bacterium]|nr:tRNA (adenosine(37)-N6)-dimethylallyltransferase MiaA [Candidatus Yanofskybacteria bacterium]